MPLVDPVARDAYERQWRLNDVQANGNRTRLREKDWKLRKQYGITLSDRQWMYATQGGVCAIRGCTEPATDVDHDHATKKVRALLCHSCNTSLHHRFTPDHLLALGEYLEAHGGS